MLTCNKELHHKNFFHLFHLKQFFIVLFLSTITIDAIGQDKYEVISNSNLNVRNRPSTSSSIIGTLSPHTQIEVYATTALWATIDYKGKTGYVSTKYIKKIETEKPPIKEKIEVDHNNTIIEHKTLNVNIKKQNESTNLFCIDFVPSIYGGFSNFMSDAASPKGRIGFGADLAFQFTANKNGGFLPKNYYIEASLGYSCRGSAAYPLH